MKRLNFAFATLTVSVLASSAFAGPGASGGGDLLCDAKIKSISGNLAGWIQGQGPQVGSLDLSSSKFPNTNTAYSFAQYDQAMLDLLKLPLDSSCVTNGDPGYPVQIGDASKVCASYVDNVGLHLKCDQVKFLGMDPDIQIEQIHHEFAINAPGLEPDYGPISTYKISTQLSAFTRDVNERRLVVLPKTPLDTFGFDEAAADYAKGYLPKSSDLNGSWVLVGEAIANPIYNDLFYYSIAPISDLIGASIVSSLPIKDSGYKKTDGSDAGKLVFQGNQGDFAGGPVSQSASANIIGIATAAGAVDYDGPYPVTFGNGAANFTRLFMQSGQPNSQLVHECREVGNAGTKMICKVEFLLDDGKYCENTAPGGTCVSNKFYQDLHGHIFTYLAFEKK